jgi:hypothetical protein
LPAGFFEAAVFVLEVLAFDVPVDFVEAAAFVLEVLAFDVPVEFFEFADFEADDVVLLPEVEAFFEAAVFDPFVDVDPLGSMDVAIS